MAGRSMQRALLVAVTIGLFSSPVAAQVARFALVVGNNRGAERLDALRYAERDAERFSRLLVDLGGFEPERVVLLKGDSLAAFREALARIEREIEKVVPAVMPRALLVLYFSGHADGINLEFGRELLPFDEFRELVRGSAASVKIAFVDSCQSGGLTSIKGGRPAPAFDLVVRDQLDASGTVVLTSSAAGENSQESGQIQGSFFTHYLLSGLRGAADHNRDSRVTLAEVYQYAYNRTVVETARTLAGTQHPTYQYRLEGRGEVVLTDISRGQARLRFGPDTAGEFLVMRRGSGQVLAELEKAFGCFRELALPAGSYRLALRRGGRLYAQEIGLQPGTRHRVDPARMREQGSLLATLKQGGDARSGWGIFVHYGLMSGALDNFAAVHQAMAGLRIDLGPTTLFPRFSYGEASLDEGPLSYHIRLLAFESYLTWRFAYSILDLFCGLKLGVSHGTQRLTGGDEFSGTIFGYAGVIGMDLPLYAGLALQVFWEVGGEVFRWDDEFSQHVSLKGVIGLGYQF